MAELPRLDHLMHERASLEEAFAAPFGGTFSPAAGLHMTAFFSRVG